MTRRTWPVVLGLLFLGHLAWVLLYTERIADALRANAATLSRLYAQVQEAMADPGLVGEPWPPDAVELLFRLQGTLLEARVPLVLTGPGDTVFGAANLPFPVDLATSQGQARVRAYVRELDRRTQPLGDPQVALLHFGDPPEIRGLRWVPWLQAGGFLVTLLLALYLVQMRKRAEEERGWNAMARELAHQLGTPLSSFQGWLELLRLPPGERPAGLSTEQILQEMEKDLERLEKTSRRFELIGRPPTLDAIPVDRLLSSLRSYLEPRLPHLGPGVRLEVVVEHPLHPVQGSETLLLWALENLVKNSLDALGGKGGTIRIRARNQGAGAVEISVSDTGPGVPPGARRKLFRAGFTTRPGGWGVGLSLARRIVEGVHGGRLELASAGGGGGETIFTLRLPAAAGGRGGGER